MNGRDARKGLTPKRRTFGRMTDRATQVAAASFSDLAPGRRREDNVYNFEIEYTSMRTNIVIDDRLMHDVLEATGLATKREAVELGLRTLLRLYRQAEIRRYRGKLPWEGDLEAMRLDT